MAVSYTHLDVYKRQVLVSSLLVSVGEVVSMLEPVVSNEVSVGETKEIEESVLEDGGLPTSGVSEVGVSLESGRDVPAGELDSEESSVVPGSIIEVPVS